ncbi:MAG: hypothetical protein J5590_04935 [Clostridia bacterium]|nr:hypothetical protein [Clostridia bacterium]
MKKTISLILAALCLVYIASCGYKESIVDFNFEMTKEDVSKLCEGSEKSDKYHYEGVSAYIRKDIPYLTGEEVTVFYYFDKDSGKLDRTVYYLSECSEKNIEKMKKSLDKKYNRVRNDTTELDGVSKTTIKWESDDMDIIYNSGNKDGKVSSSISFEKREAN